MKRKPRKPKVMIEITRADYLSAYRNWDEIMNPITYIDGNTFASFIGKRDVVCDLLYRSIMVTEPAYRKIMMLKSPHARALLHAFIARTGYQKRIPCRTK